MKRARRIWHDQQFRTNGNRDFCKGIFVSGDSHWKRGVTEEQDAEDEERGLQLEEILVDIQHGFRLYVSKYRALVNGPDINTHYYNEP